MPGSSVVFPLYKTTLHRPDHSHGNRLTPTLSRSVPDTISVYPRGYGNAVLRTRANLFSFSDVDPAIANIVRSTW